MIKIILWDIDATLLDFLKSESMALKKTFLHFGLGECPDSKVAEYSAINQSYWNKLETGELTKEQVLVGIMMLTQKNFANTLRLRFPIVSNLWVMPKV